MDDPGSLNDIWRPKSWNNFRSDFLNIWPFARGKAVTTVLHRIKTHTRTQVFHFVCVCLCVEGVSLIHGRRTKKKKLESFPTCGWQLIAMISNTSCTLQYLRFWFIEARPFFVCWQFATIGARIRGTSTTKQFSLCLVLVTIQLVSRWISPFFFVLAEMLLLNLDDTLPRTRVNKLRHLFMRPPLFFFLHRLYSTRYIKLNILDGDSTARIDCESSRFLRIDFKAINHILAFPRRVPPTLSKQLISGNK